VISTTGTVLQRVEASDVYKKERVKVHAKTSKAQGTKRTMDDTTSERKVKPLPSQNRALMANAPLLTANLRPPKRQRVESWEEQYLAEDLGRGQLYTISQDDSDNDVGEEYVDDDLFQAHPNVMDFQPASRFYAHQHIHPRRMHDRAPPSFHDIAQGGLLPPSARSLDRRPFPPLDLLIRSHPMWFPVLCLLVLPFLLLPRNKQLLGLVAWVLQNCNPAKHITARNRQTDLILMRWTIN